MHGYGSEIARRIVGPGLAVWIAACTGSSSPSASLGNEEAVGSLDATHDTLDAGPTLDAGDGMCDLSSPDERCDLVLEDVVPPSPEVWGDEAHDEIYLGVDQYDQVEGVLPEDAYVPGEGQPDPPGTTMFANQNPGVRLGCLSKAGLDQGKRWGTSWKTWNAYLTRIYNGWGLEVGNFTMGGWRPKVKCVFVADPTTPGKGICQADPKVDNLTAGGVTIWPVWASTYDKTTAVDAPTNGLASWGRAMFAEGAGASPWAMPVVGFTVGPISIAFVINNATAKEGRNGEWTDICVLKDLNQP
jgi:hypothetical protein